MIVALTGATGNMGVQAVRELLKLPDIELKLLVFPKEKRISELKKICRTSLPDQTGAKITRKMRKSNAARVSFVYGGLQDANVCRQLVEGADYVVNLAAVIPPHSDQHPQSAIDCNEKGVGNLVDAIERAQKQPKLIHTSTVALYGNRNTKHLWARVGDPLLVSPFDIYSITKMRGEFRVLESDIKNKVVLRQTAMLHNNMLSDNMHDGLMFHTCFNAPLEWVTAEDSGRLIARIIAKDIAENALPAEQKQLPKLFWNRCFNIGGGPVNCVTGYDVLDDGFRIIGGSVKDFFRPNFNATRNFHGVWFADGDKLNDLFDYQRQSTRDFWIKFEKEHKILKAGKAVPKGLIRKFAIERLFGSPNSPRYWYKHGDEARMIAYFGKGEYEKIPNWDKFALLNEGKDEAGNDVDYAALKDRAAAPMCDIGFDENGTPTIADLAHIAEMHGGKLLSQEGGIYDRLEWENSDGVRFAAKGYTVMCGHWINPSYGSKYYPHLKQEYCWDFDRLAKTDKLYAQLWYDSHAADENYYYCYDENFVAQYGKLK